MLYQASTLFIALLWTLPTALASTDVAGACRNLGSSPFYLQLVSGPSQVNNSYGAYQESALGFGNTISSANKFHIYNSQLYLGPSNNDPAVVPKTSGPQPFLFHPRFEPKIPVNCHVANNCSLSCNTTIDGVAYRTLELDIDGVIDSGAVVSSDGPLLDTEYFFDLAISNGLYYQDGRWEPASVVAVPVALVKSTMTTTTTTTMSTARTRTRTKAATASAE